MFAAPKRSRIRAVMIGVAAHADALEKWCTLRGHRDIAAMLAPTLDSGMRQWRRNMPDADEMNSYVDLINIYIAKSPTLMFGQVELATALLEMHGQLSCFPCKIPVVLEAKDISGVMMNGFSRYRDLRYHEKFAVVVKGSIEAKLTPLRQIQATVAAAFADRGSLAIVPFTRHGDQPTVEDDPLAALEGLLADGVEDQVSSVASSPMTPSSLLLQRRAFAGSTPSTAHESPLHVCPLAELERLVDLPGCLSLQLK